MTTTTHPASVAQLWRIDPVHTSVEFAVKHLMIAKVKGRFDEVAGTVTGHLSDPASLQLDVTLQTASIDTHQAQRDEHLRSADFFNAERWPTIRFVGKRLEGDPSSEFRIVGDLTIRDVTREVVLDVVNEGTASDPWGGFRAGYSLKGKIDRRDFGLTWNQALEAGGFVVGDEIKLSADVELTAVAEAAAA